MIKVLVIEDEAPARDLLKAFISRNSQLELIGEAQDGFQGVKAINELKPDLIFLDIQMPKLTGFEMLELIEHKPVIVFCTAYDEYALKAFEHNTADYLLKPFPYERFQQAIEKAIKKVNSGENHEEAYQTIAMQASNPGKYLDRIVIRSGGAIHVVTAQELDCIEAEDDYVMVYGAKGSYLKQQTLKYYEEKLDPSVFLRVHRSAIVKIDSVARIEPYSKDAFIAILKSGKKLPVSKAGYARLKNVFDI